MTKADRENRMVLVAILARKFPDVAPHHIASDVDRLGSIGTAARRLSERNCNEGLPEGYVTRRRRSLEKSAAKVLTTYPGVSASVGGDPRGYAFHLRGLPGNTWGGDKEGYGLN